MRSSKSRSRSKSNRNTPPNRSMGNIINRVFDSSGPEGKVRGTPQQIIEKYYQLARDAQLGNDRVAAENFQQHAEHYTRILSAAQREMDARREEQERQNRDRQAERDRDRPQRQDRDSGEQMAESNQPRAQQGRDGQQPRETQNRDDDRVSHRERRPVEDTGDQPDVVDLTGPDAEDSGLVETPEAKAAAKPAPKPRAPRAPRKPKPEASADAAPEAPANPSESAAE